MYAHSDFGLFLEGSKSRILHVHVLSVTNDKLNYIITSVCFSLLVVIPNDNKSKKKKSTLIPTFFTTVHRYLESFPVSV